MYKDNLGENRVNSSKSAVLKLLSAWQWTRRFRQPACRFYPSCSEYSRQAIEKHGLAAGLRLGVVRLCKCHPFHDGGVDEVPETVTPLLEQMVMKTGLNPVFAGSKGRIRARQRLFQR